MQILLPFVDVIDETGYLPFTKSYYHYKDGNFLGFLLETRPSHVSLETKG